MTSKQISEKKFDTIFACMRKIIASVNFLQCNVQGDSRLDIDHSLSQVISHGICTNILSEERAIELTDKFENFVLSLTEEYRGAVLQFVDDALQEIAVKHEREKALAVRESYARFIGHIPLSFNDALKSAPEEVIKICEAIYEGIVEGHSNEKGGCRHE